MFHKKNDTEFVSVNSTGWENLNIKDTRNLLVNSVWHCIRKLTPTLIVLKNCFFTVTDKDLCVVKSFINKNSDKDISNYVFENGTNLGSSEFGINALYLSRKANKSIIMLKEDQSASAFKRLDCIATPIKQKSDIVGYICLSSIASGNTDLLLIFIESLATNIENYMIMTKLRLTVNKYLNSTSRYEKDNSTFSFTEKEKLITNYLKLSYSNEKMANDFFISEATVKTYLKRIYEKCGTTNRTETAILLICNELEQCF